MHKRWMRILLVNSFFIAVATISINTMISTVGAQSNELPVSVVHDNSDKTQIVKQKVADAQTGGNIPIDPNASSDSNPVTVPMCEPSTTYNPELAAPLPVNAGVNIVQDPTSTYSVYGNDMETILQQMRQCGPNGEFAGQTSSKMAWSYSFVRDSETTCAVRNIRISLRTQIIVPVWKTVPSQAVSVTPKIQSFITHLQAHENQHAQIDAQYAYTLYDNLVASTGLNCDTIKSQVGDAIRSVLSKQKAANETFDIQTNHGSTQGATF